MSVIKVKIFSKGDENLSLPKYLVQQKLCPELIIFYMNKNFHFSLTCDKNEKNLLYQKKIFIISRKVFYSTNLTEK